jgi:two-component system, NtrC family, sensor histidine kinase AtoS
LKKKIVITLIVACLFALIGGASLLVLTDHAASRYDELIMLHQVEILRQQLLLEIRKVALDLSSLNTRKPQPAEAVNNHIKVMGSVLDSCSKCHHSAEVMTKINDLQHDGDEYARAVRMTFKNLTAGHGRNAKRSQRIRQMRQEDMERVRLIGDSFAYKVDSIIVLTKKKLADKTREAALDSYRTKIIVVMVVTAGPVLVALFVFLAGRSFTKPIKTLVGAARKLKSGALDHRVIGLKDEFEELAVAFNDMAVSLKENMTAIEESEGRYRHLFDNAADAIFILDVEGNQAGKILQANNASAEMHGYSVEELLNMNINDLNSSDSALGYASRMQQILNGKRLRAELNRRRKDGTIFPVEIGAGLFDVGGRKYILVIDREITERKRAEEAIQRAEQIRSSAELATGMAHEIKNPLAGIKLSIQMLLEEQQLSEDNQTVIKKVIDEIKRIEQLMKGLLNFAKPPKPHLANTDVQEVLESVTALILHDRPSLREGAGSIHLQKVFGPRVPTTLADPMQLKQVFMNLFLNAVDAMPNGGTITLKTSFDTTSRNIFIDISDTGSGINESVLPEIFKPFYTTKPKGTGLGLAISKRLIEEHGGTIHFENNIDQGATVRIGLPTITSERMTAL